MYGEVLDTANIAGISRGEEDETFTSLQQILAEIVQEREQGRVPESNQIIMQMYEVIKRINEGRDVASIKKDVSVSQDYNPGKQTYWIDADGDTNEQRYENDAKGNNDIMKLLGEIRERATFFPVTSERLGEVILDLADAKGDEFTIAMFKCMADINDNVKLIDTSREKIEKDYER